MVTTIQSNESEACHMGRGEGTLKGLPKSEGTLKEIPKFVGESAVSVGSPIRKSKHPLELHLSPIKIHKEGRDGDTLLAIVKELGSIRAQLRLLKKEIAILREPRVAHAEKAIANWDATAHNLMHDIELNPGPSEDDYAQFLFVTLKKLPNVHERMRFVQETIEDYCSSYVHICDDLKTLPCTCKGCVDPFRGLLCGLLNHALAVDIISPLFRAILKFAHLYLIKKMPRAMSAENPQGCAGDLVLSLLFKKVCLRLLAPVLQGGGMSMPSVPVQMKHVFDDEAINKAKDAAKDVFGNFPKKFAESARDSFMEAVDVQSLFDTLKGFAKNTCVTIGIIVSLLLTLIPNMVVKVGGLIAVVGVAAYNYVGTRFFKRLMEFVVSFCTSTSQAGDEVVIEETGVSEATKVYTYANSRATEIIGLVIELFSFSIFSLDLDFKSIKDFGKTVDLWNRFSKSFSEVGVRIQKWLEKVIGIIRGYWDTSISNLTGPYADRLQSIFRRFAEWVEVLGNRSPTQDESRKLRDIIKELDILYGTIPVNSEMTPLRTAMQNLYSRIQPYKDLMLDPGVSRVSKITPQLLYLTGATSVGKSIMQRFMIQGLANLYCSDAELVDFNKSDEGFVYTQASGDPYYDRYNDQFVFVLPDLFTSADCRGQEGEPALIINAVGPNAQSLDAAAVFNKGKKYFSSKIILAFGNQPYINGSQFESIKNVFALTRRLGHLSFVPTVKPAFQRPCPKQPGHVDILGKENDTSFWYAVDADKITENTDPDDIWLFHRVDVNNGRLVDVEPVVMSELLLMLDYGIKHFNKTDSTFAKASVNFGKNLRERSKDNEVGLSEALYRKYGDRTTGIAREAPAHTDFERRRIEERERIIQNARIRSAGIELKRMSSSNDKEDKKVPSSSLDKEEKVFKSRDRRVSLQGSVSAMQVKTPKLQSGTEEPLDDLSYYGEEDCSSDDASTVNTSYVRDDASTWPSDMPDVVRDVLGNTFGMSSNGSSDNGSDYHSFSDDADVASALYSIDENVMAELENMRDQKGIFRAKKEIKSMLRKTSYTTDFWVETVSKQVDNEEFSFRQYLEEYVNHCKMLGERVSSVTFASINGYPLTAYHMLLDELPLADLEKLVSSKMSMSQIMGIIKIRVLEPTASFFGSVSEHMRIVFDDFSERLKDRVDGSVSWFDDHPVLTNFIIGGGLFGLSVGIAWFVKFIVSLFGDGKTNTSSPVVRDEKVVFPIVEPDEPGFKHTTVQGVNQGGIEPVDAFLKPRRASCMIIELQYKCNGVTLAKHLGQVCFLGGYMGVMPYHFKTYMEDVLTLHGGMPRRQNGSVNTKQEILAAEKKSGLRIVLKEFYRLSTSEGGCLPLLYSSLRWPGNVAKLRKHELVIMQIPSSSRDRFSSRMYNSLPSKEDHSYWDLLMKTRPGRFKLEGVFIAGNDQDPGRKWAKLQYNGPISFEASETYATSMTLVDGVMKPVAYAHGKLETITIEHSAFIYEYNSVYGDCGSPFYIYDKSAFKIAASGGGQYGNPIWAYMHTSFVNGLACGSLLYKELFDDVKDYIVTPNKTPFDVISDTVNIYNDEFEKVCNQGGLVRLEPVDEQPVGFKSYHHVFGKVTPIRQAKSNPIRKSPEFNCFVDYRPLKKPSKLRDYIKDEVHIRPLRDSREMYGSNEQTTFRSDVMQFISLKIAGAVMQRSTPPRFRDALEYSEIVSKLDRSTSAGYFLNVFKQKNGIIGTGRKWIWGDDEKPDLNGKYALMVESLFHRFDDIIRNDGDIANFNTDCLKAELLPLDKKGTRMFQSSDLVTLLLFHKYFYRFMVWFIENRYNNYSNLGCDPVKEFKTYYMKMRSKNTKGLFGDFGKFDKRQRLELLEVVFILIRKYYGNDDLVANTARERLFSTIRFSLHVTEDDGEFWLYKWMHGNISGCLLTAIINSMVCLLVIVYTGSAIRLDELGEDIDTITDVTRIPVDYILDNCDITTSGDDHSVVPTPELESVVNCLTFMQFVPKLTGLEYTDDTKGAGEVVPLKPITEGMMIARYCRPTTINGEFVVLCPLRDISLFERMYWDKKSDDPFVQQQKLDTFLVELARKGKNIFERESVAICARFHERLNYYSPFEDFDVAFCEAVNVEKPTFFKNYEALAIGVEESTPVACLDSDLTDCRLEAGHELIIMTSTTNMLSRGYGMYSQIKVSSVEAITSGENQDYKPFSKIDDEGLIKVKATCQSGKEEKVVNNDNTTTVVCDSEMTTCFTEAESIVNQQFSNGRVGDYDSGLNDIKVFLGKPYLIGSFQYSTSTAANTNLFSTNIMSLMSSVGVWSDKLKGFNLARGDFNLRVEVNANICQAGRLLIHFIPMYDYVNALQSEAWRNNSLMTKIQHPNLELDLRSTAAVYTIPYVSPSEYYAFKEVQFEVGKLFIDAMVPMRTGTSGNPFVEVNVFGYWTDVDLSAHSIPQAGKEKVVRKTRKTRAAAETKPSGPISGGLELVAKVADTVSDVPILKEFAEPISWVARAASGVASIFGFSAPTLLANHGVVFSQIGRYLGTSTGAHVAVPLAAIADNETEITGKFSLTEEDELNIRYLLDIPCLFDTVNWSTGLASGSSLFSLYLTPSIMRNLGSTTYAGKTANWEQGPPIFYLSKMFGQWRGSFDMVLKFIKCEQHSGKIVVTWTPTTSTTAAAVTLTNSIYSWRHIIDVREQSEVRLNLPYEIYKTYCLTQETGGSLAEVSGRVDIMVLNDLRAPETCGQSLDMLIYFIAGKDFEYAVPSGTNKSGAADWTPIHNPVPFMPQSGKEKVLQSGNEVIVDSGIGDHPEKPLTTDRSRACVGEHIMSLRTLLLRSSPMLNSIAWSTLVPATTWSFTLDPYAPTAISINTSTGALTYPHLFGDMFSYIALCYRFMRGKVRINVTNGQTGNTMTGLMACVAPGAFRNPTASPNMLSTNQLAVGQTLVGAYPWDYKGTAAALSCGHTTLDSVGSFEVPYYNQFPVSVIIPWTGNGSKVEQTHPLSTLVVASSNYTSGNLQKVSFSRSISEDFQFSFFICCPPVLEGYA